MAECSVMRRNREKEGEHNNIPTRNTCKETATTEQQEEPQRKGKNRNKRRNRNKDTLAGPSGTKDSHNMHNNNSKTCEVFHDTSSELVETNDRVHNDAPSSIAATTTNAANLVVQENEEMGKVPDSLSEGHCSTNPIHKGGITTLVIYNSPEIVNPIHMHLVNSREQQDDLQSSKNMFQVLVEAEFLLRLPSWAEMAEEIDEESTKKEGEWQTHKKKYNKSKWMEQQLSPPSTRARVASKFSQ
ncbi:hypothetical protein IFM89_020315 [Coptis chinensis]|uniref:Uncharacterized protein n=1 Tax=Coptis chinensis TaxID=261450 RepID=A0A835HIU3_9MAGN|nr:hypothetical protein IFM89_020315 [Coptis chinensis]